jgi:hypothetical protein
MGGTVMSKFKEAIERGKAARSIQEQRSGKTGAERDGAATDYRARARAWLKAVVVKSLEAAKAEVAGEVIINIDTTPLDAERATPSVRFQVFRTPGAGEKPPAPKTFTVEVEVDGGAYVSSPGMVSKDAGGIVDKSAARFTTVLAELIEEAVKAPATPAPSPSQPDRP